LTAMPANEDQIKFWNEKAGQNWTILQARMDANMAALGDAVLAFAQAKPGMAVLDVGCGTGFTSLALAGAGAKVTGLDISKPMLALARERAAKAGLRHHRLRRVTHLVPRRSCFEACVQRWTRYKCVPLGDRAPSQFSDRPVAARRCELLAAACCTPSAACWCF